MFDMRPGGWRAFELFGTPVYFQPNYLFLILMAVFQLAEEGMGVVFIVVFAITASILLHELGHVLALRYFGQPSIVTIYAFGGFTSHPEGMRGWPGMIVSVAGPLAGLLVWTVTWFAFMPEPARSEGLRGDLDAIFEPAMAIVRIPFGTWTLGDRLWYELCRINLFLSLVNLAPIHPLDGGQILREALGLGMRANRALRLTTQVGMIGGLVMAWLGYTHFESSFMVIIFLMLAFQNYETWRLLR